MSGPPIRAAKGRTVFFRKGREKISALSLVPSGFGADIRLFP